MKAEKKLSVEEQVTKDCPMLFCMRHRPCNETCMSNGFECHEGWHKAIASACRELEMLNVMYYPKFRVRIQAEQIKEKFGTLRFYWSVVQDPNTLYVWLGHKLELIADFLNSSRRFDYKMKKVVDAAHYDYDNKHEIDKETYDKRTSGRCKPMNVEYIADNGKYFEICHLHNHEKSHYVPTKHKIIWKLMNACSSIKNKLLCSVPRADNAKARNCIELMDRRASKIIRDVEAECESICEWCGCQIGADWSPSCKTLGRISYICEDCAVKSSARYIKNGELWSEGKKIEQK